MGLLWLVSVGLNEKRVCIELVESGRLITFALGAHSMGGDCGKHWKALDRIRSVRVHCLDFIRWFDIDCFNLVWAGLGQIAGLHWVGLVCVSRLSLNG